MFREVDAIIASRVESHKPANQGISRTIATEVIGDEFSFVPCSVNFLKLKLKVALCGLRRFLGRKSAIEVIGSPQVIGINLGDDS